MLAIFADLFPVVCSFISYTIVPTMRRPGKTKIETDCCEKKYKWLFQQFSISYHQKLHIYSEIFLLEQKGGLPEKSSTSRCKTLYHSHNNTFF